MGPDLRGIYATTVRLTPKPGPARRKVDLVCAAEEYAFRPMPENDVHSANVARLAPCNLGYIDDANTMDACKVILL